MEVLHEMSLQLHGRAGSRKGSWLQTWSDASDKGLKLPVAQNSSVHWTESCSFPYCSGLLSSPGCRGMSHLYQEHHRSHGAQILGCDAVRPVSSFYYRNAASHGSHPQGSSSAFTPVAPQPFSCCAEINAPKENATPAFCLSGISLKVLKTYICVSLDVLWVFPLKLTKWIRLHRIKAKWVLTHHAGKSRWSGSLEGKEEESAELAPFILCFYLFKGYFF